MKIHNILEEQIIARVKTICNDKDIQNAPWFSCDSEHCRLDITAYVLNRIQPRYVVSERGIAHAVADAEYQLDADVDFLIIEAIKKVSTVRRSFHSKDFLADEDIDELASAFNFPIFYGSVFDGNTFQPISIGSVTLKYDNQVLEMLDETWYNPYHLHTRTKGSYTFWPKSIQSEHYDEEKTFNFLIEAESENYEKTRYAFSYNLVSTKQQDSTPDATNKFKVEDIYLFPIGDDE